MQTFKVWFALVLLVLIGAAVVAGFLFAIGHAVARMMGAL